MSPISLSTFPVPRILSNLLIILLIVSSVLYALFQARLLIQGPTLELTDIPDSVVNERQITLKGTANNITELYLNGRAIVTDEEGVFTESVVLENGYSVVRIDALDRYGRRTHVEAPFVYKPVEENSFN